MIQSRRNFEDGYVRSIGGVVSKIRAQWWMDEGCESTGGFELTKNAWTILGESVLDGPLRGQGAMVSTFVCYMDTQRRKASLL